jgi:RHS repeat-associated protein
VSSNFVYDGPDVVRDLNSDGSTVDYLNGLGIDNKLRQSTTPAPLPGPGGIGLIIGAATALYYQQDHLGSTTALTDALGNVVERESYDAFGNTTASASSRYGYTGRELDPDTGLMYHRARWYDPQVGRFLSEDPISFGGGDVNLYSYVKNNNPPRDPDKEDECFKKCEHLLGLPGDYGNRFRKCYRECRGTL